MKDQMTKFYSGLREKFLTKEEFLKMWKEEIDVCISEGKTLSEMQSFIRWGIKMLEHEITLEEIENMSKKYS